MRRLFKNEKWEMKSFNHWTLQKSIIEFVKNQFLKMNHSFRDVHFSFLKECQSLNFSFFHFWFFIFDTRSGPDRDQTGTRSGADLEQMWTRSGPDLDQIWTRSGPDLDQIRTRLEPDRYQIGTRSGPDRDQIGTRAGSDLDQIWTRSGPDLALKRTRLWRDLGHVSNETQN